MAAGSLAGRQGGRAPFAAPLGARGTARSTAIACMSAASGERKYGRAPKKSWRNVAGSLCLTSPNAHSTTRRAGRPADFDKNGIYLKIPFKSGFGVVLG